MNFFYLHVRINYGFSLGLTLGGGGGVCWRTTLPFLIYLTPCRSKGSPFVLFWDTHFWLTDLENLGLKVRTNPGLNGPGLVFFELKT